MEARILGPWQGRLGNSDERLELRKPGELTAAGNIPSILVEAIHYHATAPWPTGAAGAGASLQRLVASAYGNDSTNWFAAGYSPGQPNRFDQPPAVALTAPTNGSVLTAGSAVPVIAAASDPDGSVVKVRFFSDGAPFAESTNAPFSATWLCSAGPHLLGAVALDNGGVSSTSAVVSVMGQVSISTNFLAVASNSVWRYLDDGTDQGVAWTNLTFNDTSWSNGVAQIGFGDGDEATKVRATNATTSGRIVTYYFRRTFVLGSVAGITNALLRLQRDDGAIAYLNGAEVARQNMPSGAVGYHTLASSSISGTSENTMFPTNVNPGVFRAGTNIIAVEVHQATTGTSEDMSFAAELAISQAYSGPALRASPVSQTVQAGDTVQFSVMAVGTAPLSYQWLFNLTNLLPNASAPTLTLTNVSPVNAGSYQVVVSNPVGSVTSAVASLVVTSPPPRLDAVILPPAPGQPVTISFSAVTGNSYTLQYCNTLGPSNWRCLTNWPPFVVSQQVSAQDPTSVGQPQRFYRLVTPATICNP